jgi:hypothetical protein
MINVGKAIKKELFSLIKDNLDDHESRITSLALGASPVEVFNFPVFNASSSASFTGLAYFTASAAFTVSSVQIQIWDKGLITSGTLSIDIQKGTSTNGTTFNSILTTQPIINFASDADYVVKYGALDVTQQSVAQGDILRLDVTSLPTIPLGKFKVLVYGNI